MFNIFKNDRYSISFYGFFGHDEAIGAVMSSIRLSYHEIRAFLFKGYWYNLVRT